MRPIRFFYEIKRAGGWKRCLRLTDMFGTTGEKALIPGWRVKPEARVKAQMESKQLLVDSVLGMLPKYSKMLLSSVLK